MYIGIYTYTHLGAHRSDDRRGAAAVVVASSLVMRFFRVRRLSSCFFFFGIAVITGDELGGEEGMGVALLV